MDLFIVLLFVFVPLFILIFVPTSLLLSLVSYHRFKFRNQEMEVLAHEEGLRFESGLPSFFDFWWRGFFKDLRLNTLKGVINGHQIAISDTFWPSLLNILFRYRRQTLIEIDGKPVQGNLKFWSFGSWFYLTTIIELKQYLESLKH